MIAIKSASGSSSVIGWYFESAFQFLAVNGYSSASGSRSKSATGLVFDFGSPSEIE